MAEETEETDATLAEIYADEEPEETVVTAEEPEPEAAEEPEPEPAKTGEEEPAAGGELTDDQVAALPPAEQGQYKGLKAERTKRQALEEKVATQSEQIDKLLAALQQPKPAEPTAPAAEEEEVSFWDDPEKFLQKSQSRLERVVQDQRLHSSEMLAKARHDDYDEMYSTFAQVVASAPNGREVMQQILASPDPAEAAYQQGVRLRQSAKIAEAGGLEAYVAAKVKEAQEATTATEEAAVVETVQLPKPMATRRSVGSARATGPDYSQDIPLNDLYGN